MKNKGLKLLFYFCEHREDLVFKMCSQGTFLVEYCELQKQNLSSLSFRYGIKSFKQIP